MSSLREAAQQALDWLYDNDILHPTKVSEDLRAALAQQAEPQAGCETEADCTSQPWCRISGECHRKQDEPVKPHRWEGDHNIESPFNACMHKSYCMSLKQAEPVEPVAWRWGYRSVTTGEMDWRGYVEIAAHPNLRSPEIIIEPLYTAPPRCPNCGSLEAQNTELDDMLVAMEHAVAQGAAVERKACADICDAQASCEGIAQQCAAAIRARGQA